MTSYFYKEIDSEKQYICAAPDSSGMHKCSDLPPFAEDGVDCYGSIETGLRNASECINWNQYYTDCKPGEMNPFHGAISFDNIGLAWVAIFLVRTESENKHTTLEIGRIVHQSCMSGGRQPVCCFESVASNVNVCTIIIKGIRSARLRGLDSVFFPSLDPKLRRKEGGYEIESRSRGKKSG